ncbi:helix-turn-helix domain-containing protein [Jutongia sp. SJQ-6]|jgi:transcriptional regulator with XRE-family HTH domain
MQEELLNQKEIAKNLKKIRKTQKITQKQLGALIGKSERTIQNYEAGKIDFDTNLLRILASALQINWTMLLHSDTTSIQNLTKRSNPTLRTLGDVFSVLLQIQQSGNLSLELDITKPPTSPQWKSYLSIAGKGNSCYDADFCLFIEDWITKKTQLDNNELSFEEYMIWQEEVIRYYSKNILNIQK